jgi:hypothetical protein
MESARSSVDIARENTKAVSQYFVESARSVEASSGAVAYEKSRR